MLDKDLYTVQEIAMLIGKTTQSVYSKLDNLKKSGKEYTITGADGKKRVKREFISDFYADVVSDQQEQKSEQEQSETLQAVELASLRAKAEEQEKQIEQLQSRIEAQQRTIEQLQQMNINNQMLLSQNQALLLQATSQTEEASADDDKQETSERKPSFWSRFKR